LQSRHAHELAFSPVTRRGNDLVARPDISASKRNRGTQRSSSEQLFGTFFGRFEPGVCSCSMSFGQ